MKIVSWNVNSLKARAFHVESFLDTVQPDVLAIQELKLETDKVPREMFLSRGYQLAVHGQKQWNGVLIASKYDISDVHKGLEGSDDGQSRFVAATIQGIRFINLYCPQGQNETSEKYAYKLRFFDGLLHRLNERHNPDVPLVLLGDINIGPRSEDVFWDTEEQPNVVTHHPLELEKFQNLIDWGLEDLGQKLLGEGSEGFTFWDYRTFWDWKSRRYRYDLGVRIDHFMVTASVAERALSMQVHRKWRHKKNKIKPSDHAPVELVLSAATHGGDLGASASPS